MTARTATPRASGIRGHWRITWMATWPDDYLDLEKPAFIEFGANQQGEFCFGAVRGWTDYRATQRDGQLAMEFSWQGLCEGDELCGRGWATLSDAILSGHIFIHNGDDSAFKATRRTMYPRRPKPGGG